MLDEICRQIDKAAQLYYSCNQPIMTDAEYDALMDKLRELDPDNPRLTRVGPPVIRLGNRGKKQHDMPMGSLDNISGSIAGFADWYRRLLTALGISPHATTAVVVSLKMDGASAAVVYDGKIQQAVSRGNGMVGDDITENAALWRGVPISVTEKITVRGECLLFKDEFQAMVNNGLDYSNARNAGNGIMGRLDGLYNDKLRFIAFDSSDDPTDRRYSTKLSNLQQLGFEVVEHAVISGNYVTVVSEVNKWYESVLAKRDLLPFEIDGIVVAIDNLDYQDSLVKNERDRLRPRYAAAIKPPTNRAITRVKGVILTVGHTGAIIPTAVLEPVWLMGVSIDSALLNNWNQDSDNIAACHIAVGDVVEIERAGDTIPKVSAIIEPVFRYSPDKFVGTIDEFVRSYGVVQFRKVYREAAPLFIRPSDSYPDPSNTLPVINGELLERPTLLEPVVCPSCGSATTRVNRGKEGAVTYCSDPSNCPAVARYKIKHFIGDSKRGMGILGIGDAILNALTSGDNPLVKTVADLYRLDSSRLANLVIGTSVAGNTLTVGYNRATSILQEIEKSKQVPLAKFLGSLGVDLLGERRAADLIHSLGLNTIDDWLDPHKLSKIPGDTIRESIVFGITSITPLIRELLSLGVLSTSIKESVVEPSVPIDRSEEWSGISFCFTGTRECIDEVQARGATVKSGVSKGLTYLVQKSAESVSNKTQKAIEYGTKIISVDYLKKVLAGEAELP